MIPKIIHQIWTQGCDKVPEKYRKYQDKWKNKSGYKYICWDDKSIKELIKKFDKSLLEVYNYFELPQQRSDLGRYIILYLFGGFYIDIDIEAGDKSLDEIIYNDFIIARNDYYIRQSFFGSIPKHIILSRAIEHIRKNYQRRFYEVFDVLFVERTTGGIISKLIKEDFGDSVSYIKPDSVYICESIDDCRMNNNLIAMIHFEKSWNLLKYLHRFLVFYKYIMILTSIFLILVVFTSCRNKFINYLCTLKNLIILLMITTMIYIVFDFIKNNKLSRDGLVYLGLLIVSYISLSKKCNICTI
jgi:mannosyltransferase OCH1-like enzyme